MRVCTTAVQRGWISERVPLPKLSRKGEKGSVRPAFTAEEVATLRAFMTTWETKGKIPKKFVEDFEKGKK